MGLQIKRSTHVKVRILSTVIAAFALIAQPMYGVLASHVANAATLPMLNEIMPAPTSGSEWVEVYNPSHFNLEDYSIKDDDGNGMSFGHTTNTATYALLNVSMINNDGDVISLHNAANTTIDTITVPNAASYHDQSYGRSTDGATNLQWFSTSTKGATNAPAPVAPTIASVTPTSGNFTNASDINSQSTVVTVNKGTAALKGIDVTPTGNLLAAMKAELTTNSNSSYSASLLSTPFHLCGDTSKPYTPYTCADNALSKTVTNLSGITIAYADTNTTGTWTMTISNGLAHRLASDGLDYGYTVKAVDADGNPSSEVSRTFTQRGPVENVTDSKYFPTIQAAINASTTGNGDVIKVAAGTYNENVTLTKAVKLEGAGASHTTIIGQAGSTKGTVNVAGGVSGVTMSGFTVQQGDATPDALNIEKGKNSQHSSLTVTNNIFVASNGGYAVDGDNITNSTFSGNTFKVADNTTPSILVYIGGEAGANSNVNFTDNTFNGSLGAHLAFSSNATSSAFDGNKLNAIAAPGKDKLVEILGTTATNTVEANQYPAGWASVNAGTNNFKGVYRLQKAVDIATDGDTVGLTGNTQPLTQQLTINKPITIDGNGYTMTANFTKNDNDNNSLIGLQAPAKLENLIVDGANGTNLHGINAWHTNGTAQLYNVTVKNNDHSGVNIGEDASARVTNIKTSGNGWDGIDVDKPNSSLWMGGGASNNFDEDYGTPAIYVDDTNVGSVKLDNPQLYTSVVHYKVHPDKAYFPVSNIPVAPTDLRPSTLINTLTPTYTWNSSSDHITRYQIQVSTKKNDFHSQYIVDQQTDLSNTSYTPSSALSSDGTYYWRVRARNSLGVWSNYSAVSSFTVDHKSPESPANIAVYSGHNSNGIDKLTGDKSSPLAYTNNTSIRIAWTPSSSDDVDHYCFGTKLNPCHKQFNKSYMANHTDVNGDIYYDGTMTPGYNPYFYTVIAVDAATNMSTAIKTGSIMLDQSSPTVKISAPGNNSTVNNAVSVTVKAHDDIALDHIVVHLTMPDGTTHPKSGTCLWNTHTVSGQDATINCSLSGLTTNGKYMLKVAAADMAGNPVARDNITFTIDNTPPNAPTISPASGTTAKGQFNYTVAAAASDGGNVSEVEQKIGDSGTWTPVGTGADTYTIDTTMLIKGTNIYVRATSLDGAGNSAYSSEHKYTVNNNIVSGLTINDPASDNNGKFTLSGTVIAPTGSEVIVTNENGVRYGVGTVDADGNWSVLVGNLSADTPYQFYVTVSDATGLGYSDMAHKRFTTPTVNVSSVHQQRSLFRPFATTATPAALGVQTQQQQTLQGAGDSSDTGVLGAQDTKGNKGVLGDTATLASSSQGWKILGFAWYWWLLLIAAVLALWWFLAARRRASENA